MGRYHERTHRTTHAGPPARTISHRLRILSLLRERGEKELLGSELYARPDLYGRSPRNRISELRAAGALIEGKPHGACDWWYRLVHAHGAEGSIESDYMRRERQERDEAMPLFAGVPQ